MTKNNLDAWERQRKKEIEEFIAGRDWSHIFYTWKKRLDDFSISLNPLFTEVWVHDPKYPTDRENSYSWWPSDSIHELQLDLQRHLDHFPGTIGPIHPWAYYTRKGELETLDYLWENKEDIEKVAAILISASLFSRLESSRRNYPRDEWPPFSCVEAIFDLAIAKWFDGEYGLPWHRSCTQVLPDISHDYDYKIDNLYALIRYLAEEHASVFSSFKPVSIIFKTVRDPFIEKKLCEEYTLERKNRELWEQNQARIKRQEKIAEEQRKKEHPRIDEWHDISNDELKRLVWSMPTVKIAKKFGVSDVAIAKRCKSAGIPKPPVGFWAKVEAGKIPHPKGQPLKSK